MNDNNLINVKQVGQFKHFAITIGALPTSYLESMSYYELLAWFCNFLKNDVIPTVNNNADAVLELQQLYIQLKQYVDNYFKNLDVQEEINNKLDSMAESGELQKILADILINSNMKLHFVQTNKATAVSGDCCVIEGKTKNGIIDFGYQESGDDLIQYLILNNILTIDYVVISHFHGDHVGGDSCEGFLNVIDNSRLDFSKCTFYLPPLPNSENWIGNEIEAITNRYNIIKNKIDEIGGTIVTPTEEQVINIEDKVDMKFYNVNPNYYAEYYPITFQSNGSFEGTGTNYNNFSMVCDITNLHQKFLFTGDIENKAQELIYQELSSYNVYSAEHHGANDTTYNQYLAKIVPHDYYIIEQNINLGYEDQTNTYMRAIGIPTYGTMQSGDTIIVSNGYTCYCTSKNGPILNQVNLLYYYNGMNIDGFPLGKPIRNDDDLNNYLTAGIFRSVSSVTTNSLLNCPLTGTGFKLSVEKINSNEFIRQTILANNMNNYYIRYRYTTDGTNYIWSDWIKTSTNYTSVPEQRIPNNGNLNDYNQPGTYYALANANITNSPTSLPFRVENKCINGSTRIIQHLIGNNLDSNRIVEYQRLYTATTSGDNWTEWEIVNNPYGLGKVFNNGDNLDNYQTPGTYYASYGGMASSLQNSPITNTGFKLEVKQISNNHTFIQYAYPNNSLNYYVRNRYTTDGTNYIWSAWKQVTI